MKKVLALVLIFAGGLFLMAHAPPGVADQFVNYDDVTIEMSIDNPEVLVAIDRHQAAENVIILEAIYHGGVVLQTYEASWTDATINKDYTLIGYEYTNQVAVRTARDGLSYSSGHSTATLNQTRPEMDSLEYTMEIETRTRLDIGESPATWRIQETYT